MNFSIKITIPGRIGGKGRPKFTTRGGFARAYTPAKTRSTEAMVREFGAQAMDGRPPIEGPVGLTMAIIQAPAVSWSKKKRAGAFWVTGKPDIDNIVKLVGDSLNSIVWRDDAQISAFHVERRYSTTEPERVEISIESLGAAAWDGAGQLL